MRTRPIFKVDAFTRSPLQGNPAGVMPNARGLGAEEMLGVARELNVSETAFVLPSREADLRIRFFTPTQEVPFCGHALVATLALLEQEGTLEVQGAFTRVVVETDVGVLPAELVREEGSVRVDLTQAPPAFRPCTVPADRILEVMGADPSDLRSDLPLELAYTGLWHLLVPLTSADALDGLLPDFRALASINRELGVLTTHVFVEEDHTFHCRGFAPAAGVDEDPVTGTASGALGAYLFRHGVIPAATPVYMTQGEACRRPGEARVVVSGTGSVPESVVVGGHAVVSIRGEIWLGEGG